MRFNLGGPRLNRISNSSYANGKVGRYRVEMRNCPQISGGGAPDRLHVLEDRESCHIGDWRHVGGDPGAVRSRPRDPRRGKHAGCNVRLVSSSGPSFTYVVPVYVDSLRVPRGRRPTGEPDGLSGPAAVRLDVLPGVLLLHELRVAPRADMHLLHVGADEIVARRPRQRRESTRQEARHQARLRRRRGLCRLLVSHTGKIVVYPRAPSAIFSLHSRHHCYRVAGDTGEQVPGRVPAHHDDDNGADCQPYPRLYQQLRQPLSIRLPER